MPKTSSQNQEKIKDLRKVIMAPKRKIFIQVGQVRMEVVKHCVMLFTEDLLNNDKPLKDFVNNVELFENENYIVLELLPV